MAGVAFWLDQSKNPDQTSFDIAPDPWSVVLLGSNLIAIPGLLENGDIHWRKHPHRVIDRGRKTSSDGATPKFQGFGVAEFDLPMVIWNRSQLQALSQLIPAIWPKKSSPVTTIQSPGVAVAPGNGIPGATGTIGLNLTQGTQGGGSRGTVQSDKPLLIQHPALTLDGISQVILEGWTPPMRWQGRNDIKVYRLHCIEFNPSVASQSSTPTQVAKTPIHQGTLPVATNNTPPSQVGAGPNLTLQ